MEREIDSLREGGAPVELDYQGGMVLKGPQIGKFVVANRAPKAC